MASRVLHSILARRPQVVVCAAMLALSWAGCGYRSQIAPSAGEQSEGRVVRVAVEALRNDSREPWLDRVVQDALRRERQGTTAAWLNQALIGARATPDANMRFFGDGYQKSKKMIWNARCMSMRPMT